METRASFLSLCAHSFVWWLLTNALGAAILYGRFLLLTAGAAHGSAGDFIDLWLTSLLIPWFIATYLTLLWPVFALLPQWWALTARQPRARRDRLLLVVITPFALLIFSLAAWQHTEALLFIGCYLLAALGAAAWIFRQWLW